MASTEVYEHKTVRMPSAQHAGARKKRDRILSKMAADGWELVNATDRSPMWANSATFRRKKWLP